LSSTGLPVSPTSVVSTLSFGERASKTLWWILGGPLVSGVVLGALAWLSQNLLYGILIGLAAWAVAQVGFTVWGIRRLTEKAESLADSTSETPDAEQLANEKSEAQAEVEALKGEIELARPDTGGVFVPTVEPDDLLRRIQELEEEKVQLEDENERLRSHPDDEVLKRRCFRLSEELFPFVENREETNPQKRPEEIPGRWKRSQEESRHDDETRAQYARRFGSEAGALLDALERRRWIESEDRRVFEETIKSTFRSPAIRIRELAQRLGAFGRRL
jgi:cell division protein FtsB